MEEFMDFHGIFPGNMALVVPGSPGHQRRPEGSAGAESAEPRGGLVVARIGFDGRMNQLASTW